jgi:beta-lactamase class A
MVNNSNALTTRIADILDYGADGSTGLYLKEVNGPVLASLQQGFVFEPASSLKVTHHLHAMRQVMMGFDNLNAPVTSRSTTPAAARSAGRRSRTRPWPGRSRP